MNTCRECEYVEHLTWEEERSRGRLGSHISKESRWLCLRFPPTSSGGFKSKGRDELIKYSGYNIVFEFNIACGEFEKRKKL